MNPKLQQLPLSNTNLLMANFAAPQNLTQQVIKTNLPMPNSANNAATNIINAPSSGGDSAQLDQQVIDFISNLLENPSSSKKTATASENGRGATSANAFRAPGQTNTTDNQKPAPAGSSNPNSTRLAAPDTSEQQEAEDEGGDDLDVQWSGFITRQGKQKI